MKYQKMTHKELMVDITKGDRVSAIEKHLKGGYLLQKGNGLTNIIIPAKIQENKIAVIAHHDIFPGSKGYNDNSTGVEMLIRLQDKVKDNVELVFTDGEEKGGRGCNYYLGNGVKPVQAINLDVIGLGDTIFYEMYGGPVGYSIPKHLKYYPHIPFSDSHILRNHNVPNILMLTGKSSQALITDIFHAQHNGKNDGNLDLISEKMLCKVYSTLISMIGKKQEPKWKFWRG